MPAPRLHPAVRLLICTLGILLPTFFIKSLMSGAIISLAGFTGRNAATEVNEFWANPANLLISKLLICPFILLVIISCRRFLDLRSFDSLGLHPRGSLRPLVVGALCGTLAIVFLFGMLVISGGVRIEGYSREAFERSTFDSIKMCVLYFLLFFAIGYTEELIFRGYGLHNLYAFLNWRVAVGVQAIAFSFIHFANLWIAHAAALQLPPDALNNAVSAVGPSGSAVANHETFWALMWDVRWGLVNIALIGVFAALSYRKTGSLWFPIGFSLAWDFCLGCVFSLPVSGVPVFRILEVVSAPNTTLSGGSFGAEGSIMLTCIMVVILWLQRDVPSHPQADRDFALLKPPFAGDNDLQPGSVAAAASGLNSGAPEVAGEEPVEELHNNRFRTRMGGIGAPELAPEELESLARELSASANRAAASSAIPLNTAADVAATGLTSSGGESPEAFRPESSSTWDAFKVDVTEVPVPLPAPEDAEVSVETASLNSYDHPVASPDIPLAGQKPSNEVSFDEEHRREEIAPSTGQTSPEPSAVPLRPTPPTKPKAPRW